MIPQYENDYDKKPDTLIWNSMEITLNDMFRPYLPKLGRLMWIERSC